MAYRTFLIWGGAVVVLLTAFLLFMAIGWPGGPDSCMKVVNGALVKLDDGQFNHCYCEAFTLSDVLHNAPGVRQKINTWFNLYSIVTSGIVATMLYLSRRDLDQGGSEVNVITSNNLIADVYVFAVLFLGLGSMWFHASLTTGLAWMDGFSMYVYTAFLVFYTVRRHWEADWFFWIFYPLTVVLFTVLGIVFGDFEFTSVILIAILVIAYIVLEFTLGWVKGGAALALWICGAVAMGLAVLFWKLSQTGGILCHPQSNFQPHGFAVAPLGRGDGGADVFLLAAGEPELVMGNYT